MSLSPSQSSISAAPLDSSSDHVASATSTPPTSFSDNISITSDVIKHEATPAPEPQLKAQETPSSTRPRRARASAPTYNLAQLSGTAAHGKRRADGEQSASRKRRNISGDTLVEGAQADAQTRPSSAGVNHIVRDGIDALKLDWSFKGLDTPGKKAGESSTTPRATRANAHLLTNKTKNVISKATSLGKRGRKAVQQGFSKMTREMRRLQDTNEFAHVDTKPVVHTIWAKGKLITLAELEAREKEEKEGPPQKKAKITKDAAEAQQKDGKKDGKKSEAAEETIEVHTRKGRRTKQWLDRGLYSGQPAPATWADGLSTAAEKKRLAEIPELAHTGPLNKTFPLPIFNGLRLLMNGRDFKLPYDICNPLPPGQPKPEHWTKISKNRFVGDAGLLWKKKPHLSVDGSLCICKPEDGCGEDCQNRIMLYECDDKNCNVGKERCTNRAFADLQIRKAGGGKYRTGVEVIKTSDRGYGVRANRCFDANQIIMEYTGEIITEEECDNRMRTKYKNNDCYYLMSFDQNMIIDATTGSIARFVNHSCKPNCRMIKWIVSGQPRMALFAGDSPIMTGDELTYDYNFDPFSAKNVQKCLCGEENCRGVLGPRPKDQKPPKTAKPSPKVKGKGKGKSALKKVKTASKMTAKVKVKALPKATIKSAKTKAKVATATKKKTTIKATVKSVIKAGKRKLADMADAAEDEGKSPKKRKIKAATGVKRSISNASSKVAKAASKGAATVRKSVSTVTVNAKTAPSGKKKTTSKVTTVQMSSHGRVIKASTKRRDSDQEAIISSSRASSTTIVAASQDASTPSRGKTGAKAVRTPSSAKSPKAVKSPKSRGSAAKSPRKALDLPRADSRIRMVSPEATITARVAA